MLPESQHTKGGNTMAKTMKALEAELSARLEEALSRIETLEKEVAEAKGAARTTNGRLARAEAAAAKMRRQHEEQRDLLAGTLLDKAGAQSAEVHDLYRALMAKVTVAGEVAWLAVRNGEADARDLTLAVVRAYDLPRDWWMARESWTLERWLKELRHIVRHGLPHIAPAIEEEAA